MSPSDRSLNGSFLGSTNVLADIGSPRIKCNDRTRQQYCDIRFLRKVSGERSAEGSACVFRNSALQLKKASQDVPIALKVTNDVKHRSTVLAFGGVAIASTGVVAAVYDKSRNSEARESEESTNARQNVAPFCCCAVSARVGHCPSTSADWWNFVFYLEFQLQERTNVFIWLVYLYAVCISINNKLQYQLQVP